VCAFKVVKNHLKCNQTCQIRVRPTTINVPVTGRWYG